MCEKDRNVGSNICQQQLYRLAVMFSRSRSAPDQRRQLHFKCSITTAKESKSVISAGRMFKSGSVLTTIHTIQVICECDVSKFERKKKENIN